MFFPNVCAGVDQYLESLVADDEWIGRLRKIILESGRASEEDIPKGDMRGGEMKSIADEMTDKIGAMRVQWGGETVCVSLYTNTNSVRYRNTSQSENARLETANLMVVGALGRAFDRAYGVWRGVMVEW